MTEMGVRQEEKHGAPKELVTSREPVNPASETKQSKNGQQLFNDALTLVIAAWAIVIVMMFLFRRVNK